MAKGKPINVKIATVKVIKALEDKLAEIKANYAKQGELEAKFEKATADWQNQVIKFAIDNVSKATNFRTNYRSWNGVLNIDFDVHCAESEFPTQPKRDFEWQHENAYNEIVEELENAIRILKMTDEEVVNTSTYNAIARYL